jgi:hypothetical protein
MTLEGEQMLIELRNIYWKLTPHHSREKKLKARAFIPDENDVVLHKKRVK